jgi:CopG family nickel-responsive transcriptional regulator
MDRETKTRFSLSISPDLAEGLDAFVERCGYPSRSQAVSDIIRERLTQNLAEAPETVIVGTITLLYDHHRRNLNASLTDVQHDYHALVRSVLHVHVDHYLCMEVLAVCGPSAQVREMADRLITTKGVQNGKLAVTSIACEGGADHHHANG